GHLGCDGHERRRDRVALAEAIVRVIDPPAFGPLDCLDTERQRHLARRVVPAEHFGRETLIGHVTRVVLSELSKAVVLQRTALRLGRLPVRRERELSRDVTEIVRLVRMADVVRDFDVVVNRADVDAEEPVQHDHVVLPEVLTAFRAMRVRQKLTDRIEERLIEYLDLIAVRLVWRLCDRDLEELARIEHELTRPEWMPDPNTAQLA